MQKLVVTNQTSILSVNRKKLSSRMKVSLQYSESLFLSYMIVPSSAALQNMKGTLGATASRLTRPTWHEKTWVFSSAPVSYTRILQSAAPDTRIESLVLGRNYIWKKFKKSSISISFFFIITKQSGWKYIFIPPAKKVLEGGYIRITLSICLSVQSTVYSLSQDIYAEYLNNF